MTKRPEHDLKSITKHPFDENSLLVSDTKSSIYHLNLTTQVYTLLTTITETEITDIEWLTTSNGSFLVISNKKEDCLQSMDIISLQVVEYFGQCGSEVVTTNTDLANTGLKDPNQLGFNEKDEILYVSVKDDGHHLIRCDLKLKTTTEVLTPPNSKVTLPSNKNFHFSQVIDDILIVSDDGTNEVSLLNIASLALLHVEPVEDLAFGVKNVAQVANISLGVKHEKIWIKESVELCLTSSCSYLRDVKFLKQLSPFRIAVYEHSKYLHVVGVDIVEPASTAAPVTNPPLPKSRTNGHFQLNILHRGGFCNGENVSNISGVSSPEHCGYICIKNRHCQALAYDVMTGNCHLYASCEGIVNMESIDSYAVALH